MLTSVPQQWQGCTLLGPAGMAWPHGSGHGLWASARGGVQLLCNGLYRHCQRSLKLHAIWPSSKGMEEPLVQGTGYEPGTLPGVRCSYQGSGAAAIPFLLQIYNLLIISHVERGWALLFGRTWVRSSMKCRKLGDPAVLRAVPESDLTV